MDEDYSRKISKNINEIEILESRLSLLNQELDVFKENNSDLQFNTEILENLENQLESNYSKLSNKMSAWENMEIEILKNLCDDKTIQEYHDLLIEEQKLLDVGLGEEMQSINQIINKLEGDIKVFKRKHGKLNDQMIKEKKERSETIARLISKRKPIPIKMKVERQIDEDYSKKSRKFEGKINSMEKKLRQLKEDRREIRKKAYDFSESSNTKNNAKVERRLFQLKNRKELIERNIKQKETRNNILQSELVKEIDESKNIEKEIKEIYDKIKIQNEKRDQHEQKYAKYYEKCKLQKELQESMQILKEENIILNTINDLSRSVQNKDIQNGIVRPPPNPQNIRDSTIFVQNLNN